MLLVTLEYLREYRTYFHPGKSYGVSESNAYKITQWVEDTLIDSRQFSLPGKKALTRQSSDTDIEAVLTDATETPVERPEKNKNSTIPGRKSGMP